MTIEEAIDVLDRNYPDKCFGILCDAVDMAIKALEAHKEGRWVTTGVEHLVECDQCHKRRMFGDTMQFCPNCGAKMEVEHDFN